ncbi:MAG: hypothetical protein WEA58_07400 [Balneolaceae bacterium]
MLIKQLKDELFDEMMPRKAPEPGKAPADDKVTVGWWSAYQYPNYAWYCFTPISKVQGTWCRVQGVNRRKRNTADRQRPLPTEKTFSVRRFLC